jgi:hypothetical protein
MKTRQVVSKFIEVAGVIEYDLSLKMTDKPKASHNIVKRIAHGYPQELTLKIICQSSFLSTFPTICFTSRLSIILQNTFLTIKKNEKYTKPYNRLLCYNRLVMWEASHPLQHVNMQESYNTYLRIITTSLHEKTPSFLLYCFTKNVWYCAMLRGT